MTSRICAHRGIIQEFQENTVDGIHAVEASGADMVEFDVQHTSDGVWILHHDLYLFEEDYLIVENRYDDIVAKAEQEDWQIDTLDTLLGRLPKVELNFECKSQTFEAGKELADILNSASISTDYNISSFFTDTLRGVHDQDPQTRISLLGYLLPWIKWRSFHFRRPLYSINPLVRFVGPFKVWQAHRLGIELHTFTANSKEEIELCLNSEVDVIITDNVYKAMEIRSQYLQNSSN